MAETVKLSALDDNSARPSNLIGFDEKLKVDSIASLAILRKGYLLVPASR